MVPQVSPWKGEKNGASWPCDTIRVLEEVEELVKGV